MRHTTINTEGPAEFQIPRKMQAKYFGFDDSRDVSITCIIVYRIGPQVAHWNELKMERGMMLLTCRKLRCNDSANVPVRGCQI